MNTILEAQTSSTSDPVLLHPCHSVSTAGKCKDSKSRLSLCTALDHPHNSSATAGVTSPSWAQTESPGLAPLSSTTASPQTDIDAVSTCLLKSPDAASSAPRTSYTAVVSELLAASSPNTSPANTSHRPKGNRSSLMNSPVDSTNSQLEWLGAAEGALDKLLTGKISRARVSLSLHSTSRAAAGESCSLGAAATAASAAGAPQSNSSSNSQPADKPPGTVTTRISLANVGLLAASGAGLLPGSPLADTSSAAAAFFSTSSSSSNVAPGRSSMAGGKQQQQRQSVMVTGHGAPTSTTAAVQQQQDDAATGAVRKSSGSSAGLSGQMQQFQQQQPLLQQHLSNTNAMASVRSPNSKQADQQQQRTGITDENTARDEDSSSSSPGKRPGTAAFKTTSREQANRLSMAKVMVGDAPSPAHYRPHHAMIEKHVPVTRIVPPTSSRPVSPNRAAAAGIAACSPAPVHAAPAANTGAAAVVTASIARRVSMRASQQHDHQEGLVATGVSLETKLAAGTGGAAATVAAAAASVRGSVTDATPRPGDDGPLKGMQPYRVHERKKAQNGTSAFKAVSREQLQRQQQPVSAGASGEGSCDYYREGYDALVRPRSGRGPVPIFHKQTSRPASAATTDCPAALGPGAYHRSGQLPISYTGSDVPAGHTGGTCTHGALEFDKYSSRPGSAPAGCESKHNNGLFAGTAAAGQEWPGLWGWSAAAQGCVNQACCVDDLGELHVQEPSMSQYSGVHSKQRPSSQDALAYMRRHGPTDLVETAGQVETGTDGAAASAVCAAGSSILDEGICMRWQLQQRYQQRPASGLIKRMQHSAGIRPATAGPVLERAAAAAYSTGRPGSACTAGCSMESAARGSKQRASSAVVKASDRSRPGTGSMPGASDLQMYCSAGLTTHVKGGAWSTSSRTAATKVLRAMSVGSVIPPASVAASQPGTELAYDPNPEVLGHMHRSPGWQLPPNRTAQSKKWARLAAKAGMH